MSQGTIMNERRTLSVLDAFSRILKVTAAYLGLPPIRPARISVHSDAHQRLGMQERRH
jgi:hypothetical protein